MKKKKQKNKIVFRFLVVIGFLFIIPQNVEAQFLKKLQKHAEEKIEREAQKRAERKVDKTIDKGFDEAENTIDGVTKPSLDTKGSSEKSNKKPSNSGTSSEGNNNPDSNITEQSTAPTVVWSKFDFVPGDTVIFEDGPSTDEENGEFPSRWDLIGGNAEIVEVDGEPVIMFIDGGTIVPYLKNSNEDYLPEVFTIEFDVWFEKRSSTSNRYFISFKDTKNQNRSSNFNERLVVYPNGLEFLNTDKRYPGTEANSWSEEPIGRWRHISIAYTKGKFKAYMDDTRLVNIPHLEKNPWGITITGLNDKMYLKNIRIAKGGVKYYDRVLSEGKIIVNGIKFDTNKATLKAESMGPINKIYQLMQKQPDLNFSVEGHTDSDGDDASNMTLSKARGKSVMNKLIEMGISANRLKSNGFGERKPLDNNSTPEGKANNRRVEFVKFEGGVIPSVKSNNSAGNPTFDKLDKASTEAKLYKLFEQDHYTSIPISNNTGTVNGPGTVIVYATSDGNIGKMEILDVDKTNNFKLTIRYVTYNDDGSVHYKSNHFEIKGTYTCDLDKENAKDIIHSEIDFHFSIANSTNTSLNPGELSSFRILK